jgi:hypothetical protein
MGKVGTRSRSYQKASYDVSSNVNANFTARIASWF